MFIPHFELNGSAGAIWRGRQLGDLADSIGQEPLGHAVLGDVLVPGAKKDRKRPEVKQTGPPTTMPRRKPVAGQQEPRLTAFSSSSNLATPPISPTEPVAPSSPSTTTTHLYLQPVSPESLEYGRAGPSSAKVNDTIKMDNSAIIFKAVSPDELRRGPIPTSKLSVPRTRRDGRGG